MYTIYKYPLTITDHQLLAAPILRVLSIQNQNGVLTLWAEVDTDMEADDYCDLSIAIWGTGNPRPRWLSDAFHYKATAQVSGFVWHVYIKGEPNQ